MTAGAPLGSLPVIVEKITQAAKYDPAGVGREEVREYDRFCPFIDHQFIYTPGIPLIAGTRLGAYEILSPLRGRHGRSVSRA
jgi:hypothetical protein